MKILIEGTVAEFMAMRDEKATVPLTVEFGKRVGTAIVYKNGTIIAEVVDEEIRRLISDRSKTGWSIARA